MSLASVAERVREIAERAAAENSLELVRAEVAGAASRPVVRVFIDKPGGVSHEDCARMSLHIGTILDVEDFIASAYTLEVSSPGLERELYSLADYTRFAGSLAKLKTRVLVGDQRNFRGRIVETNGENVIFDDKTKGRVEIPFGVIVKANLEIDIEEELKRSGKQVVENE